MRSLAQLMAAARGGFGVVFSLFPRQIAEAWIGPRGAERPAQLLARSVAARDVALGAGALLAVRNGGGSDWFAANALCDAADLAATLALRDALPESSAKATVAIAGGSMVACAALAVALARD